MNRDFALSQQISIPILTQLPGEAIELLRVMLFVGVSVHIGGIDKRAYAVLVKDALHVILHGMKIGFCPCIAMTVNKADGVGDKVKMQAGGILVNGKDRLIFSAEEVRQSLRYLSDHKGGESATFVE